MGKLPNHAAMRARARHLGTLKSVSKAYRASEVQHLNKEPRNGVYRARTQDVARDPGQSPHPVNGGTGGSGPFIVTHSNNTVYSHQGGVALLQGASHGLTPPRIALRNALIGAGGGPVLVPPTNPKKPPGHIKHGEITAWRTWRVKNGYLRSVAVDARWEPGQPMTGDVQAWTGVHAWKTREQARGYSGDVIGEVELWGEVAEHEDGYRAEYAAVKSLEAMHLGLSGNALRKLRTRYGIAQPPRPADATPKLLARWSLVLVAAWVLYGALTMKIPLPSVLLGAWVVAGIAGAGITYAFFQREYPLIRDEQRAAVGGLSVFIGLLGPIGFVIAFLNSHRAKHGWLLPFSTRR